MPNKISKMITFITEDTCLSSRLSLVSMITGSFSTPAAENPTVAMTEAAYEHHHIDARRIRDCGLLQSVCMSELRNPHTNCRFAPKRPIECISRNFAPEKQRRQYRCRWGFLLKHRMCCCCKISRTQIFRLSTIFAASPRASGCSRLSEMVLIPIACATRSDQKKFPRSIVTSGNACRAIVCLEWVSWE